MGPIIRITGSDLAALFRAMQMLADRGETVIQVGIDRDGFKVRDGDAGLWSPPLGEVHRH